jgi:dihydroorotate dehydrogenase
MFRLPEDEAVINRYGFNSQGHVAALRRFQKRMQKFLYEKGMISSIQIPETVPRSLRTGKLLGVNLGKNKNSKEDCLDYVKGVQKLGPFADYLVVNISSPNTPNLRDLQKRELLEKLLMEVIHIWTKGEVKLARDGLNHCPPLLVKIAPDLNDQEVADIATVIQKVGMDGIIISNTTVSRPSTLRGGIDCILMNRRKNNSTIWWIVWHSFKAIVIGIGTKNVSADQGDYSNHWLWWN